MTLTYTLDDIEKVAEQCIEKLQGRKVMAIHGSMGAGKTTLVHAICEKKKIKGQVTSPTFSIINEYGSEEGAIFHIDLYRLKDEEEAIRSGIEDCLYSGSLCLVEWPEKAEGIFPPETLHIHIDPIDEKLRQITIDS
ncbi:MAG TPA: tRNA (adenosine(37)-N6)-threonylcarbamoyltransferase complex ATPase subunit type 1 TsaE [Chitinophagaceae bacterium]|nr:tRNA (adenosine(37)-N6)-threonylcarbamoyltransferase complex ATPase subunit type 1 TsaE [Chitinophagaceae bacterium]